MRKFVPRAPIALALLACTALAIAPVSLAVTHTLPQVGTGGVARVHGTSVELTGHVDPNGSQTTYFFQYGPTITYGSQTPVAVVGSGVTPVKVGQTVARFLPGYHYRIVATNHYGTVNGKDRVFTPKSTTKLHFLLPKHLAAVPYGGTFTLTGALSGIGAPHHEVVLQANPYPYQSGFTQLGVPVFTDSSGHFTLRAPKLLVSTEFRIATVDLKPLLSGVVAGHVAPRVVFRVHSSSRRGIVRMFGTVAPAEVGARVYLQVEKARKRAGALSEKAEERAEARGESTEMRYVSQANTVVKSATKTLSRFSLIVTVRTTGRYRALVVPRRGALVSGTSSSILVHAGTSHKHSRSHG
jgi:hypothetical protein